MVQEPLITLPDQRELTCEYHCAVVEQVLVKVILPACRRVLPDTIVGIISSDWPANKPVRLTVIVADVADDEYDTLAKLLLEQGEVCRRYNVPEFPKDAPLVRVT